MSNILKAINAVMQEIGYVKKQKSPNLNYTFAGEAALISAIRPAMVEQGLVMYVSKVYDIQNREYQTKNGAAMVNVTLTADVVFTHAESGESITVQARGEGSDSGDKANNKAMTCAYKYALRQTFMIETGDDPDGQNAPRSQNGNGNGNGNGAKIGPITPQMIIDAHYADNPINAQKVIDLLNISGKSAAEAWPRVELYRAWRVSGRDPSESAIAAIAGKQLPKE